MQETKRPGDVKGQISPRHVKVREKEGKNMWEKADKNLCRGERAILEGLFPRATITGATSYYPKLAAQRRVPTPLLSCVERNN